MGRAVVHRWNSDRARLALWCVALVLPVLLSACRRTQNLVDDVADSAYQIRPSQIALQGQDDDAFTSEDALTISATNLAYVPAPTRLRDRKPMIHWDMTLQEVIFHALTNSQVIRQGGQFNSPNNSLLRSPEGIPTIYDRRIQTTGVLFGQRGEQAALSEFDAQFTTRFLWGNSSVVQNNTFNGLTGGRVLTEETGQFQSSLQKSLYSGGQIGLSHNWNYTANNLNRLFPSAYDGVLRAEFRQPLLAGSGSHYSRIAGPISDNIQGVTGVQQGILIARLNGILAAADFEISVVGYLRDVELQYWQLFAAYENYQIRLDSLFDAKRILSIVRSRANAPGGENLRLVEAREGVLQAEKELLQAQDGVYTNESQMRIMMGFHAESERMIHPIDKPMTAELAHDWTSSLGSALARRPELRRQKAAVHSARLQLEAAENLNRARFDLLASGQTNGFGDNLLGHRRDASGTKFGNAYSRLFSGNETAWNLGFEYSQPLGLRFAGQQVKNNELKLTKATKILEAQEAEVLLQLTAAFQALDRTYLAMQTSKSLVRNAEARVDAVEADYDTNKDGRAYLDLESLNRARESLARAALEFRQSEVEYSMALTDIELRCGRLLDYHNVHLDESPDSAMRVSLGAAKTVDQSPVLPQPVLPPPKTPPAATPGRNAPVPDKVNTSDEDAEVPSEFVSTGGDAVTEDAKASVEAGVAVPEEEPQTPECAQTQLVEGAESDALEPVAVETTAPAEAVPLVEDWTRSEAENRSNAEPVDSKFNSDSIQVIEATSDAQPDSQEIEQP